MIEKNLLICGAFEGEVDIFLKNKIPALVTGVGIASSVFTLQKYLFENRKISEIIFCGSCGAYNPSGNALGEIVFSNNFVYKEIAEFHGIVKVPDLVQKKVETVSGEFSKSIILTLKSGVTNSTNSITIEDLSDNVKEMLKEVAFENMESYGLGIVANKYSLPFTAFFSVTNYVGKNGSDDWKKNWRAFSDKLQNFILNKLLL